jgi:hypothetical protein
MFVYKVESIIFLENPFIMWTTFKNRDLYE